MMRAKDALALGVADAVYEPADFLEKSISFAAKIISGKTNIARKDFTNEEAAWNTAIATGKAAVAKKYGGADIASPLVRSN